MSEQGLTAHAVDPVLPPPPTAPSWFASADPGTPAGDHPGPRRRLAFLVGAVLLIVGVVAGVLVFQLRRSGEQAQALTLGFRAGQSETYTIRMAMDGTVGEPGTGTQPVTMDLSETVAWNVRSVDPAGVATVEMVVRDMSGTMNGTPIALDASSLPPMTLRIAADGRILEAAGLSFTGQGSGTSFPGTGQYTPLLPDHPVKPGDTWSDSYSQDLPFGMGTLDYTATSTLDRYESVDGTRTAVVTTRFELPLDFTIDLGKMLKALGGRGGTGGRNLSSATIAYGGKGSFSMTAWLDPVGGRLVRTSTTGRFHMTMEMSGVPNAPGTITFDGTFRQDLERR